MKSFMFSIITLFFFALSFIATNYQNSCLLLSLMIPFLSLLPFFFNLCLIQGGFAWRTYHSSSKNTKKLCGPMGFPILGILPQMGSHAHKKLAAMAHSHGSTKLMAFSLGSTRAVVSSDPDTAKEILCGASFSDRPIKDSARLLLFGRAIGFAPSGDYWRHLRRIAANYMFAPRRISGLEGVRQRVANEVIIDGVVKEMKEKGVVEVRGILQKASLKNVLESVFGCGLGLEEEEELGFMVKEGYELLWQFNWGDYFGLGFLDFYGVKRRCFKLACKVKCVVGKIIEERRRRRRKLGDDIDELISGDDFLTVLLSLPKDDQLSDEDMVAVLWEMIFRGTDTVAILLEWIMARMVLHQDIQSKAREEIDTCVGGKRHVQDSDIPNLPFLQSIVKEVLRLHPPGPLLSWSRLAIQDVHVDKFFIPAGTTAMVNMWAITHDPSIWNDPWAFKPERFMDQDFSVMGSDLRLAPFGAGRRVCPGKALGLVTVQLWLARLLQQFKWLPAKPVDLSECLKLSLEMKKPLACRVISRAHELQFGNIN